MRMTATMRAWAIGCSVLAVGLLCDRVFDTGVVSRVADARIGRPMTPTSVAGVSRRTTRRRVRRSTRYVATLPRGCTTVIIDGASLYQCGGTYYQRDNTQYVVVYVD